MAKPGTLYGVGTGPGDPELMTVKAVRVLEKADLVAHFFKSGNPGNARQIAGRWINPDATELDLGYPVTTELNRDSDEYRRLIDDFFDQSANLIRSHLEAGRSVAVLSEGDPLFYGSYMHIHVRLADDFPAVVIPGVTAMSGCWSLAGVPVVQGDDAMIVLPGTMDEEELARRLGDSKAAIIMKVGRNLPKIIRALKAAGKFDTTIYVERGTMDAGFHIPLRDKADETAPYFSLLLVPGWSGKP